MRSLSIEERETALTHLNRVYYFRNREGKSEQYIAEKLGYQSVEHMYQSMKHEWGWPDWAVYPEPPKKPPKKKPQRTPRTPRGGDGAAEKLPAIAEATPLFELALATLRSDLQHIQHHQEVLKDGRFIATGMAPYQGGMYPSVRGATATPDDAIVRLISAYLLCTPGLSVESLLEKVHPRTDEADIKKIQRHLTGETDTDARSDALLPLAKRLAVLIRGGEHGGKGQRRTSVLRMKHMVADAIERGRKEGVSDEDIRNFLLEAKLGLSEAEIEGLGEILR